MRQIPLCLLFGTASNCVVRIQLHVWQLAACVPPACSEQLAGLLAEGCYLKQQSWSAEWYVQPPLMLTTASPQREMDTSLIWQKLACPKSWEQRKPCKETAVLSLSTNLSFFPLRAALLMALTLGYNSHSAPLLHLQTPALGLIQNPFRLRRVFLMPLAGFGLSPSRAPLLESRKPAFSLLLES